MDSIKALLLDIEGTTTPISFVKEVLFPYAYNNVNGFLTDSMNEEEIREAVALLKECSAAESGTDSNVLVCKSNDEESVIISKLTHNVKYWIEKDKKVFFFGSRLFNSVFQAELVFHFYCFLPSSSFGCYS
ncbi:hypothetical protein AB6A40_005397 [Gnathostoma spinigerum]|uniref:Enolase-phosphatase E1 n=1 Tax=Gnathostoma spinigerum TaxID=75299 RepID=A0ABD6ENX0_9BILA